MTISWKGSSLVELKGKKYRALLNPSSKADLKGSQVAVFDRSSEDHPRSDEVMHFDWPGEYDVAGVSFRGIESGEKGKEVISYVFHTPEGNVAWMGEMAEYPNEEFIKNLGEVHVLVVPVGGNKVLKAKDAFRLVEALEPMVVIPMCYGEKDDGLAPFLKEMDVKHPDAQDSYEMKKSILGSDNMELVILKGA